MKNQKGFSLIELLIVVVIIGIIAAIAIPNLFASRRAANEASAISALRTYHGAQLTYQATLGAGNYAGTSGSTNGFYYLGQARLVDSTLTPASPATRPNKNGYTFTAGSFSSSGGTAATHGAMAYPVTPGGITQTGTRNYAIQTEGVIYYNDASVSFDALENLIGNSYKIGTGTQLNN